MEDFWLLFGLQHERRTDLCLRKKHWKDFRFRNVYVGHATYARLKARIVCIWAAMRPRSHLVPTSIRFK